MLQFQRLLANRLWHSSIDRLAPWDITSIKSLRVWHNCFSSGTFEMPGIRWQSWTPELPSCLKPVNLNQNCRKSNGVLVMTSWSRGSYYTILSTSARRTKKRASIGTTKACCFRQYTVGIGAADLRSPGLIIDAITEHSEYSID